MPDPISKVSRSAIHVLLFAEYRIVLESLKNLINSNQHMSVSAGLTPGSSDDSDISQSAALSDVGVVYLSDSGQIQIVSRLLESNPAMRVVVVADGSDLESQAAALQAGAVGIVQKNQNHKFLIEAIRQTYRGETWLNQALFHRITENGKSGGKRQTNGLAASDPDSLTARELQVISEATVRHHLSSIYGKIGADDRVNMVIRAYEKGLLSCVK